MEYHEFKQEFIEKYDKQEFTKVDSIIEQLFDNDFDETKLQTTDWQVGVSVEKINQLQENVFITFTKNDDEFHLEYENGINNGTQLRDYSFSNTLEPKSRTVEAPKDVVLDESKYKGTKFSVEKAKAVFPRYKEKIKELLGKQNYDNYVTGGGTNKTDKYYKDEFEEISKFGIFWKAIYEDVEADINWKR